MDLRVDHHVYFHRAPAEADQLAAIERKLDNLIQNQSRFRRSVMSDLTRLTEEVREGTAVDQSAIQLLNGLSAQIRDLKDDPAALEALADEMDATNSELAAAVVANTPADPGDVPPDPVEPPADEDGGGGVPA